MATPTGLRAAIDLMINKIAPLLPQSQQLQLTGTSPRAEKNPTTDTLQTLLQLLKSVQTRLPTPTNNERLMVERGLLPPPSARINERIEGILFKLPLTRQLTGKSSDIRLAPIIRQLQKLLGETETTANDRPIIRRLSHLLEAVQARLPTGAGQAQAETVNRPAASSTAAKPEPAPPRPLPEPVLKLVRELISRLPTMEILRTPEGLRKAIQNSGLFLEARMAAGPASASPGHDLKADLLRLLALLQAVSQQARQTGTRAAESGLSFTRQGNPLPTGPVQSDRESMLQPTAPQPRLADDLLKQVEGALSRLQLNQLQSRTSEPEQRPAWLFDLPVRDEKSIDIIRVRIEQERRQRQTEAEPPWRVDLSFDFAELGPVHARISVRGESISTLFSADNPATVSHFRGHLNTLQSRLTLLGLSVDQIAVRQGSEPAQHPAPGISELVDEKA